MFHVISPPFHLGFDWLQVIPGSDASDGFSESESPYTARAIIQALKAVSMVSSGCQRVHDRVAQWNAATGFPLVNR